MFSLALAALLVLPAAPDTVLSHLPDAPAPASARVDVTPRVNVFALYSGDYGLGLAGGVRATSGGTVATLDGRLSQGWQGAALTVDTHDPATARAYGRLRGVASSVSRWRYHGVGSGTDADERVDLDLRSARLTAGVGVRPLATRAVTVRPEVGVRFDRLAPPTDAQQTELARGFSEASRVAVERSAGQTHTALSAGATAELDTRDRAEYPSAGTVVAVGAHHTVSADGRGLRLTRYDVRAAGFVPLGQRVVLFGRASATVTDAGDDFVPVYLLPTLDADRLAGFPDDRFRGRDLALVSVGARVPIIDAFGTFGVDATVTASAGNAYDDLFADASPTLSFGPPDDGTAALRPVLGLGLALVNIPKGRVALGGTLGLGPEGTTLLAFRLATGLGDDLPVLW